MKTRRKRKMIYDMKAHAPQLMETLLSSFSSGDGDTLVRTKKMLTQVYKNTDADKDLMAVDELKKKRYKEIEADVTKKLNDAVKKEKLEEIWTMIHSIWNTYGEQINEIESDYWETVVSVFRKTNEELESDED
jgi:superfamily I DNA and/or RNA helicase